MTYDFGISGGLLQRHSPCLHAAAIHWTVANDIEMHEVRSRPPFTSGPSVQKTSTAAPSATPSAPLGSAFDDLFASPKGQQTIPSNATACTTDNDPFAAFGGVDGAMPVVAASAPPSGRPTPGSSANNLLGLDDMAGETV